MSSVSHLLLGVGGLGIEMSSISVWNMHRRASPGHSYLVIPLMLSVMLEDFKEIVNSLTLAKRATLFVL